MAGCDKSTVYINYFPFWDGAGPEVCNYIQILLYTQVLNIPEKNILPE